MQAIDDILGYIRAGMQILAFAHVHTNTCRNIFSQGVHRFFNTILIRLFDVDNCVFTSGTTTTQVHEMKSSN